MISLEELIQNPPEGLDTFEPYDTSAPSSNAARVSALVAQHLSERGAGLAPPRVALLVGERIDQLLTRVTRSVPSLTRILLVEPDVRMVRTLQVSPPPLSGVSRLHTFVADAIGPQGPYSGDAYLESCRFVLESDSPLREALILLDADETSGSPPHAAVARALRDLAFDSSRVLLSVADDNTLSDPLFRRWGDWLREQGEAYHALKFYLRHWRRQPRPEVAVQVIQAWSALGCVAEVKRWMPLTGCESAEREQLIAEAEQNAGPGHDQLLQGLDGAIDVMVPSNLPAVRPFARPYRMHVTNGFVLEPEQAAELAVADAATGT